MPPFRFTPQRPIDYEHDPDYRAARALARKVLAPVLFIFGLVLFNPFVTTFAAAPSFGVMSMLTAGYEWPWGVLFMLIGAVHFYAFTRHRYEVYSAFAVFGTYLFIAGLFIPYGYLGTAPYTYAILASAAWHELKYVFRVFVR